MLGWSVTELAVSTFEGSIVSVKAQALLNGAKCVRDKLGDAGLERVLAACTEEVRER